MIARISLLLACALLTTAAHADDAIYRVCVGKAGANQASLARCGDERIRRADIALGGALKSALADMPGEAARKALGEEQAAWAAFRDKSCLLFSSGDFAGDAQVVSFAVCRAGVIDARVKYLKSLTDN